jgi:hypothetical protein
MIRVFLLRSGWSPLDLLVTISLVLYLAHQPLLTALGELEGRFFPAVTELTITEATAETNYSTLISGHLFRPRQGCAFRAIEWTLHGNGTEVPVVVEFLAGSIARPNGVSDFGPWRLSINVGNLRNSSAIAVHSCQYSPWLTRTLAYEGEGR